MAAAPSAPSRWLFGPGPDLLLGCGLLYALAMVAFSVAGPSIRAHQPGYVVPLLILLLSMPHYGATLVRVYDQRADRRGYVLFSVWATLLVLTAFVVGVYDARVASWLFTIYITWSPWHYTGQNYGIAMLFLRRRGVAIAPAAKRALHASYVLSFALTFLIFHGSFGTLSYSPDATGDGIAFLPLGIPVAATRVLFPAAVIGYTAALALAGVLLLRAGSLQDLVPSALVTLTQALWFSVPFGLRFWDLRTGVEPLDAQHLVHDYLFFVALGHAAQYLWVTTYYAHASRGWSGYGRYLGKTLASGAAVWTLPAVLFAPDALGHAEYGAGLALLVAAAVNVHHFILDGAIWKLRQHRIASILIRAVPADAAAEAAGPGAAWLRRGAWSAACAGLGISLFVSWATYFGYPAARARGDFTTATALLDAMSWLGRDNSKLRLSLGASRERAGDAEGALREYARAAQLAPGFRPHVAAGRVLARERRHAEAAVEFEAAIALAPSSEKIPRAAATAWLRADEPARARSVLEAALARSPDSAALHESLARVAMQLGDVEVAVAEYREAFRSDPQRVGTGNDLAWILATSGDPGVRDPEESIRIARQVVAATKERDPNTLDTLAAGLAAAGRFEEAVAVATRAADLAATRGSATRDEIALRLALYRAGRPYVAPRPPAPG